MDKKIREYADALYMKALSEAREVQNHEIAKTTREMAARGISSSGIEFGEFIRIHAETIGRQMMARLNSLRDALEHASVAPSDEDLKSVWQTAKDVYESGLKTATAHLRERVKQRGVSLDLAGGLEAAAAHHHDRVLNEWKVWRARVGLSELGLVSFGISKVPMAKELPQKSNLLADLARLLESHTGIAVLFVDLDNFKVVNDTLGHAEGDKCLERVIQIVGSAVLYKGRMYRYASGDEFIVLLPNFDEAEATATAERIRTAIEDQNPGGPVKVTASIGGVISTGEKYNSAEEALEAADHAMYKAKVKKNAVHLAGGE